jgi:hypothetical protein
MENGNGRKYRVVNGGQDVYLRSALEVMCAAALSKNGIRWEYEPKTFVLAPNLRYKPDFYLPDSDEWIEAKGWWRLGGREKIDQFRAQGHQLSVWEYKDAESALGISYRRALRLLKETVGIIELAILH